ncbi:MAG: PEP-CTERM sorting domain-containing protein [Chthoniobacterales bacterium]
MNTNPQKNNKNKSGRKWNAWLAVLLSALIGATMIGTACAQIYVATADNGAADAVTAYNANGSLFGGFTTITGNNPYGVALDGAGNLYVGNLNGPNILKYNAATGAPVAVPLGSANVPFGLAVSGNIIYDAGYSSNVVSKYNATTGAVIKNIFINVDHPSAVAFDGSGNLYVAIHGSGTVGEYNATTGAAINSSLITGFSGAGGVAVDAAGNVYVSGPSTIGKYNAVTRVFDPNFITANVSTSFSITLDGLGNLYSTNYVSGTVAKYSLADGSFESYLVTGLFHPVGITMIAAVPEPSSVALLCIGVVTFLSWKTRKTLCRKI